MAGDWDETLHPRDEVGRFEAVRAERISSRLTGTPSSRTVRTGAAVRAYQRAVENQIRAQIEHERAARIGYYSPERHERRVFASMPGARFDNSGNLSNLAEMRRRYPTR